MQQQLTHELKYKSEKALLIIGTVPSGPFTNEDEVQRVMCDWAFKGLLTPEMQLYFDALPWVLRRFLNVTSSGVHTQSWLSASI